MRWLISLTSFSEASADKSISLICRYNQAAFCKENHSREFFKNYFASFERLLYSLSYVTSKKRVAVILFVLMFYCPVNPMGSCRARSVYLTTSLLGRLSPVSG